MNKQVVNLGEIAAVVEQKHADARAKSKTKMLAKCAANRKKRKAKKKQK